MKTNATHFYFFAQDTERKASFVANSETIYGLFWELSDKVFSFEDVEDYLFKIYPFLRDIHRAIDGAFESDIDSDVVDDLMTIEIEAKDSILQGMTEPALYDLVLACAEPSLRFSIYKADCDTLEGKRVLGQPFLGYWSKE